MAALSEGLADTRGLGRQSLRENASAGAERTLALRHRLESLGRLVPPRCAGLASCRSWLGRLRRPAQGLARGGARGPHGGNPHPPDVWTARPATRGYAAPSP